jgi:hypothetical protein
MGTVTTVEKMLSVMSTAVRQAASLAALAEEGSPLETAALSLCQALLDAAEGTAAIIPGREQETAVALTALAGAILQGRTAIASRQITGEALAAADRRGYERRLAEEDATTPASNPPRHQGHLQAVS